jgi:hypothetical protein
LDELSAWGLASGTPLKRSDPAGPKGWWGFEIPATWSPDQSIGSFSGANGLSLPVAIW